MLLGNEEDFYTGRIIGAAIEVHRNLGPGFLESMYEEALAHEMVRRDISFTRQKKLQVQYKGIDIGEQRLDFLVGDKIIVEMKAIESFSSIHMAQLISYLKAANLRIGLLINFNVLSLLKGGIRRIIYDETGQKYTLGEEMAMQNDV